MEYREQIVARLRERLGREPTTEETKAERDRLIRLAYADMAVAAVTLHDAEERRHWSSRARPRPALPGCGPRTDARRGQG
jgi:hypothetical protein